MKKIVISISDEQYEKMDAHIKKGSALNLNNETFSGYGLILNNAEGGFSWLEVDMYTNLDLGDVNWSIEES
ncbi:hypothetical protein [Sediminicola sp. 1XM1-17]|uniref:hypothetical protein n=1 Tax=Sediminicola sp. 1XM1-17 TaxID=3127702 RepID=UPI00307689CC